MARSKEKHIQLHLDKVERKKLEELRQFRPECADLSESQLAHLFLKEKLFNELRFLRQNTPLFVDLVRPSFAVASC